VFGRNKRLAVAIDASALGHATVCCSGGQRGLPTKLDPNEIVRLLAAQVGLLTAAR